MAKNPNYFKQFLEKSYQDTFIDPTGKVGKNLISKINGCVSRFINSKDIQSNRIKLKNNDLIILPNGCYSKMSQSDDFQIYMDCLLQYQLNEQQIENIANCVKGVEPLECVFGCSIDVKSGGEIVYTDCCGNDIVQLIQIIGGLIEDCVSFGSVRPYEKNANPAIINEVMYSKEKCDCK